MSPLPLSLSGPLAEEVSAVYADLAAPYQLLPAPAAAEELETELFAILRHDFRYPEAQLAALRGQLAAGAEERRDSLLQLAALHTVAAAYGEPLLFTSQLPDLR